MDFAIWLDGVVLDVDTTDSLYMNYKGNKVAVPLMMRVQNDWPPFYRNLREIARIFILSPYSLEETEKVLKELEIQESFIYNEGKTKPSKEPMERFVKRFGIDPLNLIIIGSSPLDLLSARFYDSRIRVACVIRRRDCAKYSPYVQAKSLTELLVSLGKLKLL